MKIDVSTLSNEQLQLLLQEIHEISCASAPAQVKKSNVMKKLFESTDNEFYTWSEQFSAVSKSVEREILWRIQTDTW